MINNIEIDFEVYKGLTALRTSEADSYNNVIRRLLDLPGEAERNVSNGEVVEWISKGHGFPEGTLFRASHNGKSYTAEIKDGKFMHNGKVYKSFSGAAFDITRTNRNGWNFWEQKRPGSEKWIRLY